MTRTIKLGYEDGLYLLRLCRQIESLQSELNISDTGIGNLQKAKRELVRALGNPAESEQNAITGLPGDSPEWRGD